MKAVLVCLGAVLFGVVACGSSDGGGGASGGLDAAFTPKSNHNALLLVITGPSDTSYGYLSLTDCPAGTCPN